MVHPVVVVISKFFAKFSLSQIPKTVQLSTGKNSAKCNALNSYIEYVNAFAVIFADPQRTGGLQIALPTGLSRQACWDTL